MSTTREFAARFRGPDDPSDPDSTRRLRNTLKGILRRYGWRCIAIEPAAVDTQSSCTEAPKAPQTP